MSLPNSPDLSPAPREKSEERRVESPEREDQTYLSERGRERSPAPRGDSRERERENDRDSRRDRDREPDRKKEPTTTLHCGNLPSSLTEKELERKFAQFGEVVSCTIPRDPHTKQGRGFGFVSFDTLESAQNAESNFSEGGIRIEFAKRSRARDPTPGKYLGKDRARDYGSRRSYGSRDYDRRRDDRDRYDRRDDHYDRYEPRDRYASDRYERSRDYGDDRGYDRSRHYAPYGRSESRRSPDRRHH